MPIPLDNPLGLAGTPMAWAALVVMAVALVAPRTIPVLVRLLTRYLVADVRRKLGLPQEPLAHRPQLSVNVQPEVEIIPPDAPRATLRAGEQPPIDVVPAGSRSAPLWVVTSVVCGFIAVLLWWLLHSR